MMSSHTRSLVATLTMANGKAEKAEAVRHPPACLIFVFTWEEGKLGVDISVGRQQQLRDLDDVFRRSLSEVLNAPLASAHRSTRKPALDPRVDFRMAEQVRVAQAPGNPLTRLG